jgi:Protein of unknown function (DUF3500)
MHGTRTAFEEVLDIDEHGRRGRHSDGYHVAVFGTPGDDSRAWRFEGHHRAIIAALPARLREQAAIAGPAPGDIITATAPAAAGQLQPPGVPASRLPGRCRDLLGLLLGTYLGRLAPDLASAEHDRLAGSDPAFAWAGGQGEGQASYYRIQAPGLLIEYQNSQRGPGHAHTVIRRPGRRLTATCGTSNYSVPCSCGRCPCAAGVFAYPTDRHFGYSGRDHGRRVSEGARRWSPGKQRARERRSHVGLRQRTDRAFLALCRGSRL